MTCEQIGTRNHELLYNFESSMQRLTRMGIEPHQARRYALFMTLRLTRVFSTSEAWEAVDEILGPKQRATVEATSTDQIYHH